MGENVRGGETKEKMALTTQETLRIWNSTSHPLRIGPWPGHSQRPTKTQWRVPNQVIGSGTLETENGMPTCGRHDKENLYSHYR